jgi:DNA-binding Lrp family transcriptional regulator
MRLSELLERVPGVDKRFVSYLEAQGAINPTRLPKARIDRRDYSEQDVGQVRRIWRYYQRGYALNRARELAEQDVGAASFAFVGAQARGRADALEALRQSDRVLEAAVIYGEQADLVVRVEAARDEDVYQALHPAFDRGVLTGLRAIARVRPLDRPADHVRRPTAREGVAMRAFVLLRVPAKQVDRTLERLRQLEGIVEASAVYGETDIIAKLEVPSQSELDELIIRRIQDLPEVEATRTFIVVGGLHWSRA